MPRPRQIKIIKETYGYLKGEYIYVGDCMHCNVRVFSVTDTVFSYATHCDPYLDSYHRCISFKQNKNFVFTRRFKKLLSLIYGDRLKIVYDENVKEDLFNYNLTKELE